MIIRHRYPFFSPPGIRTASRTRSKRASFRLSLVHTYYIHTSMMLRWGLLAGNGLSEVVVVSSTDEHVLVTVTFAW